MHELMQELMIENARLKERVAQLDQTITYMKADQDRLLKIIESLSAPKYPTFPVTSPYPSPPYTKGCPKCGIGADGGSLGYVCNDPSCPCGLGGVRCTTSTTK